MYSAFLATALVGALDTRTPNSTECCLALSSSPALHDKVYYPNSTEYDSRLADYWSASAALTPWCMVLPLTAEDTSDVMNAIVANQCPFGIRGGGHGVFAGTSSVDEGVTIDFGYMNHTTYDPATKLASVRPGGTWNEVYRTLAPYGVTATGGRSSQVGVGGFLLGGGNALHTAAHGWGCANVENMEVVLADGSIVNANRDENPDLWAALRGGAGNFALVTRFDMRVIEFASPTDPEIWGGGVFYPWNASDAIVDAIVDFADNLHEDVDNSAEPQWGWYDSSGYPDGKYIAVALDNLANKEYPAALDKFFEIDGLLGNIMGHRSMVNRTSMAEGTTGNQNYWVTGSYNNDARVLKHGLTLFDHLIEQLKERIGTENDSGLGAVLQYQPLAKPMVKNGDGGPTVLGLDKYIATNGTGMLTIVLLAAVNPDNYPILEAVANDYQKALDDFAIGIDANWGWRYVNYADPQNDPFASYGEETVGFLNHVSREYDPGEVFQTLRKTGAKIP